MFPGQEIDLVNVQRTSIDIFMSLLPGIFLVRPAETGNIVKLGGVGRTGARRFGMISVRVRLIEKSAVPRLYTIFIYVVLLQPWDEQLEGLSVYQPVHRIGIFIPFVEIPDHGNAFGMRSPYAEYITALAVFYRGMCAHRFIQPEIGSVMEKVQRKID